TLVEKLSRGINLGGTAERRLSQIVSLVSSVRIVVGRLGWGSGLLGCTGAEASQAGEERRDFERHLVTGRGDGDRSCLHHFCLVVPRINFYASAQGQGRNLIELVVVERRAEGCQGREARDLSAFSKRVAEVRGQERVEAASVSLQRLQEQADGVELLRIRRILEQIDRFLVGGGFLFWNVLESEVLIGRVVGEQHAIVERILGTEVMSEDDVSEFM